MSTVLISLLLSLASSQLVEATGDGFEVNALLAVGTAATKSVTVNSPAGLTAALATAKSGDRILLAAGDYGSVYIRDKKFAANVTIASANPARPAHFDDLTIYNVSHILFDSLDIGRALRPGEADYSRMVSARTSDNLVFSKVKFHGSLDGNAANDGYGVVLTGGHHYTISGCTFTQLNRGFQAGSATDILIKDSSFYGLRSDGINASDVQRVTIDRNQFREFGALAGDHPDAIQFWTLGTTRASSDIVITNNVILQGKGVGTQGIFLTDQVGTLPYRNLRIENNLVYVFDGYNGIMVSGGRNVSVIGNSVLSEPSDNQKFWIRLNDTQGTVMRNNIADAFVNTKNGALAKTNNIFLDASPGAASRIRGLRLLADATVASLTTPGIGYQPK